MLDKNLEVEVINRYDGSVGYKIPELRVDRQFAPNEKKNITIQELEQLSYVPGGRVLIDDYLLINNEEVLKQILNKDVEPEYYYNENDVKRLFKDGSLDEFIDCLNFAPAGVIEMIKDLAVQIPLQDMSKRTAILEKTGFNVTAAIEAKNAPTDAESDQPIENKEAPIRRAAVPTREANSSTSRRVVVKK